MLEAVFNPENLFFRSVNKVIDLFVLSLVWLVCCIPVITAGPACAALYYAVVKAVRRQRSYPVREFFRAFRENMRRGVLVHMLLLGFGAVMFVTDVPLLLSFTDTERSVNVFFLVLFAGKLFLYLGMCCWLYPLLSRFDRGLLQIAEAALFLTVRCLPVTLLSIGTLLAAALLVVWEPLLLAAAPGAAVFLVSLPMEPALGRVCAEDNGENEDPWYRER